MSLFDGLYAWFIDGVEDFLELTNTGCNGIIGEETCHQYTLINVTLFIPLYFATNR